MDLNELIKKLLEQSVTTAVLAAGFYFFSKWVREQIGNEREDKKRCHDMHDRHAAALDGLTDALKDLKTEIGKSRGP